MGDDGFSDDDIRLNGRGLSDDDGFCDDEDDDLDEDDMPEGFHKEEGPETDF